MWAGRVGRLHVGTFQAGRLEGWQVRKSFREEDLILREEEWINITG